jgi:hypothetical protein
MPFKIVKAGNKYFVENTTTNTKYSKKPITEIKEKKQFNVFNKYLSKLEGSGLNKGEIQELVSEPLTDLDIRKYFPDADIISSSDIGNFNSISDLFPENKKCIFVIYESMPNYGHWVLISRYPNNVFEYFDSYGNEIDAPIDWVNSQKQKLLDLKPYLSDLLEKEQKNNKNINIIYNSKDFQKENKIRTIATCGRHCILRAKTIINDGQQLTDYIKMMNTIKSLSGYNYDDIVSAIINI